MFVLKQLNNLLSKKLLFSKLPKLVCRTYKSVVGATFLTMPFLRNVQNYVVMKQKILWIIFATCLYLGLTSGTQKEQSNGAPIGATGAPGELTCGKSGCHVGHNGSNNINNNTGVLTISVDGNIAQYVPNQIYTITISMSQNSIERFGFSVVALKDDSLSIGTLIVTEPSMTQLLGGVSQYSGKDYMTYTALGTSTNTIGTRSWIFQWQAPAQYEGPVQFYAAAVAANNDGTDDGDWVYTTNYDGLQNGVTEIKAKQTTLFDVFPNPVVEPSFFIDNTSAIEGDVQVLLQSIDGKLTTLLFEGKVNASNFPLRLTKPNVAAGIYLLTVQNQSQKSTKPIVLR